MSELLALLQLIQAAASLAPAIQVATGKDPAKVEAISRVLSSVLDALGRGAAGAAYLQTIGAELQALHDQGKTITQMDLAAVLGDIQDVAAEIEVERAKLDAPVKPPQSLVARTFSRQAPIRAG